MYVPLMWDYSTEKSFKQIIFTIKAPKGNFKQQNY